MLCRIKLPLIAFYLMTAVISFKVWPTENNISSYKQQHALSTVWNWQRQYFELYFSTDPAQTPLPAHTRQSSLSWGDSQDPCPLQTGHSIQSRPFKIPLAAQELQGIRYSLPVECPEYRSWVILVPFPWHLKHFVHSRPWNTPLPQHAWQVKCRPLPPSYVPLPEQLKHFVQSRPFRSAFPSQALQETCLSFEAIKVPLPRHLKHAVYSKPFNAPLPMHASQSISSSSSLNNSPLPEHLEHLVQLKPSRHWVPPQASQMTVSSSSLLSPSLHLKPRNTPLPEHLKHLAWRPSQYGSCPVRSSSKRLLLHKLHLGATASISRWIHLLCVHPWSDRGDAQGGGSARQCGHDFWLRKEASTQARQNRVAQQGDSTTLLMAPRQRGQENLVLWLQQFFAASEDVAGAARDGRRGIKRCAGRERLLLNFALGSSLLLFICHNSIPPVCWPLRKSLSGFAMTGWDKKRTLGLWYASWSNYTTKKSLPCRNYRAVSSPGRRR